MRGRLRTVLTLDAAAIAAVAILAAVGLGVPLLLHRTPAPAAVVVALAAAVLVATAVGALLLARTVARPVDRILDAAARLGGGALPPLGEGGGPALPRAALAFERVARDLEAERAALAAKVEELTRVDRRLGAAEASLARSERLATVGRLASGLAHEIGNPLGAISGYVEIARARLPAGADPDLAAAVVRIDEAAARIDRILRDLLDFARPSPPRLAPVALGALVEASVRLARVQARFKGVAVEVAVPAEAPAAWADQHQLGQVVLNLLLNAGDAMGGAGGVRISAAAEGDAVALSVADAGPGIAAADLPRLFEPFFTTKAPGEGTGLGLAISLRIVESLGGSLTAENGPGGGAVFTVRLPAAAAGGPPHLAC